MCIIRVEKLFDGGKYSKHNKRNEPRQNLFIYLFFILCKVYETFIHF